MSASAVRNIRLVSFEPGQENWVKVRHTLWPADAVERCVECGHRLPAGRHELCQRCDGAAFEAMPMMAEVRL